MKRRTLLLAGAAAVSGLPEASAQSGAVASYGAPVVELCVPPGVLSLEQKATAIKGFTEVIFRALGLTPDPSRRLFVTIVETAEGGFGVDGRVFTPKK